MTSRPGRGADNLSSTTSQDKEENDKDRAAREGLAPPQSYVARSNRRRLAAAIPVSLSQRDDTGIAVDNKTTTNCDLESVSLSCGEGGRGLTLEPTSVRCNGKSCTESFFTHPA